MDPDLPGSGPVKLRQEDLLPPPKAKPPPLGEEEEGDPREEGLQVGVGVALGVAVLGVEPGGELGKPRQEVLGHVGVGPLLQGEAAGGVGREEVDQARVPFQKPFHRLRDVHQAFLGGADVKGLHLRKGA